MNRQLSPGIRGSGRAEVIGAWVVALAVLGFLGALWPLVPGDPPALLSDHLDTEAWRRVIQAGIGLILVLVLAPPVLSTLRYRRLGPAFLVLDPPEAGVGGEVHGRIRLSTRGLGSESVRLALQAIHRRRTGSGKNRRWMESVLWEAEGRPIVEADGRDTAALLRFALPEDQPATRRETNEEIVWRLYIEVETHGETSGRYFEIPVVAKGPALGATSIPLTPSRSIHQELPPAFVRRAQVASTTEFLFPALRHLRTTLTTAGSGLLLMGLPGAILLGAHRMSGEPPMFFPVVFLTVAALMVLPILWLPLRLRVRASRDGIALRRTWLGLPFGRRHLPREAIVAFHAKSGTQVRTGTKRTAVYYRLEAQTTDGRRVRCSAGLPGRESIECYEALLASAIERPDLRPATSR